MASRILGMGDVLTLIDKASALVDEQRAADLEQKLRKNQFTLEDFLDQFQQMRKMGGMNDMLSMLPGGNKIAEQVDEDEMNRNMARTEAIILSMTPQGAPQSRDPQRLAQKAHRGGQRARRCSRSTSCSSSLSRLRP